MAAKTMIPAPALPAVNPASAAACYPAAIPDDKAAPA